MTWTLLLGALAAQTPPAPASSPDPASQEGLAREPSGPGTPVGIAEAGNYDAMAVIDQAIERRLAGDLAGGRRLLDEAEPHVEPAERAWFLYQRGIFKELAWDATGARADYEAAIQLFEHPAGGGPGGATGGATAADARFRLALVLEDLGLPAEALAQMRTLSKLRGLDDDDALTVSLQEAISRAGAARPGSGRARRAISKLLDVVAEADAAGGHSWLRAKGRYTVARGLFDEGTGIALDGSEKRIVARLEDRVEHIKLAEQQIVLVIGIRGPLPEPEWIVRSLLDLGDAWAALADALQGIREPSGLTPAELAGYRAGLGERATNLRRRAWEAFDQGVEVAARLQFESPWVGRLRDRRDAMRAMLGTAG
jgi:hypothetical protein